VRGREGEREKGKEIKKEKEERGWEKRTFF